MHMLASVAFMFKFGEFNLSYFNTKTLFENVV